jgi:sterol desaturase/sphingolipid hydroxylase (fatty acid hydroxylase superfamily)
MSHVVVDTNRDAEPIRLFKSDFLEFFTHISPVTIVVLWVPVAVLLLARSVLTITGTTFPYYIPAGVIIGLLLWTFAEYTLHRFVFHYNPRTPRQERIFFMFHGIHHAQPQVKTRLVMPFPVSIPLALVFYGLFYLVLALLLGSPQWVDPLMVGFVIGYLAYDLIHYATHHFAMHSGYLKYLKRYHMMHHYKDPNTRFGVSSPIWDWVFGTMGKNEEAA